jgi:hypothetical protein
MSHVFVSYSRKDSETVDHIVARLEQDGFDAWIDRADIRGGDLWRAEIVKAIHEAYAFVLILSPDSVISKNVGREVALAENTVREFVPLLLAPVELPDALSYTLAGIQWIEYYRDPEAKYTELVEVLQAQREKSGASQTSSTQEAELIIKGLNLSQFGPQKQEQLLDLIAEFTGTQRADLSLTQLTAGSVHAFIKMPADSAYQLKTAALNRDSRLINFGIDALRLSGDRNFVLLKTGRIGSLKAGRLGGRYWFIGGLALVIALFLSAMIISFVLPRAEIFVTTTSTSTATNTFTSTPSHTPTSSLTSTPTRTLTPTPTYTPTPTNAPPLSAPRLISPQAHQVYYLISGSCTNLTFKWSSVSKTDVTYTLDLQTDTGSNVAFFPGISGTSMNIETCSGNYRWGVRATRISDGQMGPWSPWIPFKVKKWHIRPTATPTAHCIHC